MGLKSHRNNGGRSAAGSVAAPLEALAGGRQSGGEGGGKRSPQLGRTPLEPNIILETSTTTTIPTPTPTPTPTIATITTTNTTIAWFWKVAARGISTD